MSYWDSSALVKLYVPEADSDFFHELSQTQPPPIITSEITLFEVKTTFRRKELEGILSDGGAADLARDLGSDIALGFIKIVPLSKEIEHARKEVLTRCFQPPLTRPVRTLDTIHLATALATHEDEFVATDQGLRVAAAGLGFKLVP